MKQNESTTVFVTGTRSDMVNCCSSLLHMTVNEILGFSPWGILMIFLNAIGNLSRK